MLRFLFIVIFAYLMFRAIRRLIIVLFYPRNRKEDIGTAPPEPPKKNKIITKGEGEYVDFEEVDEE